MRKSILKPLLLGSLSVMLIAFIIAGTYSYKVMTDHSMDEKIESLKGNIQKISELSSIVMANNSAPLLAIYRSTIDSVSSNTGSAIIVFDNSGTILTVSGLKKPSYIGRRINKDISETILSGKEYHKRGIIPEFFNEPTVTVGFPMYDNSRITGGVLFSLPVPEIRNANIRIFKSFFTMWIMALFFSVLLYYFVSKKVTMPIKKMSMAVTEFANGNFKKRIEYNADNEIGELAANFNNMANSIENLENMRSTFVSDVSHELRTPMTTISGFIEAILDGTVKEEEREKYLRVVLDETKRLSRLVNDLLSISKMESGEKSLEKRIFNINELVKVVLFKFEGAITEKNIDVELEFCEDCQDVYADSDAIIQVLTNLIHNASKFTPENGKISLKTWVYGKKAYVEIKNTGGGIEKDKLKFIFDRFYKTDDSRSTDKTGTGLGLFIVKNLINKHGEKIWAESEVGEYTKFTFSLTVA